MTPQMLKNLIVVLMEKLKTMFEGVEALFTHTAKKILWNHKYMFFKAIFTEILLSGTISLRTNKNVLKVKFGSPIA